MRTASPLLVLALAACGTTPTPAPVKSAPITLAAVETAMLDAAAWRVEATIHSEGKFPADLMATVLATRDNRVHIDATGTFLGQPLTLRWVSDGARTSAGEPTPPETTRALILGMARMGLLHNLVRLSGGGDAPDHAEGGAGDWVVAIDPQPDDAGAIAFALRVAGDQVGRGTVRASAGPHGVVMTERRTEVDFDGVGMTVEERYTVDLAATPAPDAFTLDAR